LVCKQTVIANITILTSLVRNIILPLDPASIGRGLFPYGATNALFTVSFPYSFIADLLVAFHWQSFLDKSSMDHLSTASPRLKKFRIPFAIICVILIVEEHTTSALRGERVQNAWELVLVTAIFILISVVGIAAFYVWTGFKIIKLISQTPQGGNRKSATVERVR
jgi:hypothetical protein